MKNFKSQSTHVLTVLSICVPMLWGCASTWTRAPQGEKRARQAAAMELLSMRAGRNLAQEDQAINQVAGAPHKLRMVEVTLFPKITEMTAKKVSPHDPSQAELGSPIKFQITRQFTVNCQSAANNNDGKKFEFSRYIDATAVSEKNAQCSIFRVKQIDPKPETAARRDDLFEAQFFMDSFYRPYGLKLQLFQGGTRRATRTVGKGFRIDPQSHLTAGMLLLPIDVANLWRMGGLKSVPADQLPYSQDGYLRKKSGIAGICAQPLEARFKTPLGQESKSYFCKDQSWPVFMETQHYVAVADKQTRNR